MKKILFMAINMNIGGTEKALLNLISQISKYEYEVTLLLLEEYGGFLEFIPENIKVEYLEDYEDIKQILNSPPLITIKQYLKNRKFIKGINLLVIHIITKILQDRSLLFKYVLKNYKLRDDNFDLAVSYAGPMDFITYYVYSKVKAKRKIQWIHFDVTKINFNINFAKRIYSKFDKIFVVSNEGKEKLNSLIPCIKNKTVVFLNIISSSLINKMAYKGNGFNDDFDGIRILTVGRLSKEKGQDITIQVLKRLKDEGYNVRWYCIGEGNDRKVYEGLVSDLKVENSYIFLGAKINPYIFMKECDIYVQPSRHEGYCITLAEARCFNNPIITTNFTGANEQIKNEITGLVVDHSKENIYLAIKRILDDSLLRNKITLNLGTDYVDTTDEIKKLLNEVNQ